MARIDQRSALELLTKPRLLEIAETFDLRATSRLRKPEIVELLVGSRKAAFRKILESLKRKELKAICRSVDLDDSGREKARIVDRILRRGFPRQPKIAPRSLRRSLPTSETNTLTKADLADQVAEATGLTKVKAEDIVNCVLEGLIDAIRSGSRIEIRGFGSFAIRSRRPRTGRNPGTGEKVEIPAKLVPYFKPGKELRIL